MYDHFDFNEIRKLYDSLRDELSRRVFIARLNCDIAPTDANIRSLTSLVTAPPDTAASKTWAREEEYRRRVREIANREGDVVLYGSSSTGIALCDDLRKEGKSVYGFCSSNQKKYADKIRGKHIYSPDWLLEHKNEVYVVISATDTYGSFTQIDDTLKERGFPEERIIRDLDRYMLSAERLSDKKTFEYGHDLEYFEFPGLYPRNTVFLDCGCYDGDTSIRFADWCRGGYSRIVAFEPDPVSYATAATHLEKSGLRDVELFPYGVSDRSGTVRFHATHEGSGRIIRSDLPDSGAYTSVQTIAIDEAVRGEDTVGFIKMDIEGAELAALHGASATIRRDKPLLAICVYHKPGDTLEIMRYCKELVPEYHFRLRHYYSDGLTDTILYASVMDARE